MIFLLLLSFALLYGSTRDDPTQYHGSADHLRMVCEIFVVLFIVGYVADEINEMEKYVVTCHKHLGFTCINFLLDSVPRKYLLGPWKLDL